MRYTDEELLNLVRQERQRSIGFGEGDNGELQAARTQALRYFKGDMSELTTLPNRSAVVDTAVADAIETVLPDVLEVFVGGEDVATFVAQDAQDEGRAEEETDWVQHVVFTENEGFLTLYSAVKDACLTRTGVFHWWWEENEKSEPVAEGLSEEYANVLAAGSPDMQSEAGEDGTISLSRQMWHGKVKIGAVPSEDFTVAPDTVSLRDATYCAMRDRPRVQELIRRGLDPEKVRELRSYTGNTDPVKLERDEAGESQSNTDGATGDLRTVEVRAHYIRLAMEEEGDLQVWRVVTDSEETMLLDKEPMGPVPPFAALTPYIVPHPFYGESVADKLIQVQQVKTVLMRSHMDQIYFALNQRNYVDMTKANEFTIPDLLNNVPGHPVRGQGEGAVTPLQAGAMNVDTLATMEYIATVAEQRSGIVRNAQGLNPDTLHDTAKGALALIAAAQKRVRMIARIFAETGIKDLFLGVHCCLRQGYGQDDKTFKPMAAKLGRSWKTAQPDQWPERCAMTVHVGVGSAGREHDLAIAGQRLEYATEAVQLQGGLDGPIIDGGNLHAMLSEWERAAGSKRGDKFWADPEDPNAPKPQPKPDPEMAKAQGQLQLAQAKAASDVQLAREKAQADVQTMTQKHQLDAEAAERQAQRDHELKLAQVQVDGELKRYQVDQELDLKRQQLVAEIELKRELGYAQAAAAHEVGMAKVSASTSQVEPGGEPG